MVYGQNQHITLSFSDSSMRSIMDAIEGQSGLRFSYNSRLFDDNKKISLHLTNVPVDSAIQVMFAEMDIRSVYLEQQIILKKDRHRKDISKVKSEPEVPVKISYTISGFTYDVASGELLIGATITIPGSTTGTISNSYGFYSLTLEDRPDSISCTYVGYGKQTFAITEGNATINFHLQEKRLSISEVVVYSGDEQMEIKTSRSSEQKIKTESIQNMPALFGEKDVIKSLSSIPGIKFFGDGSTIFYVRGGSRDQNLITIDDAPIYNPTHLLGFFSTVVPEAVKDIKVYKGDFPAQYGSRISSLIDIRTKDGNMQHFNLDASVGLLSSRISLEGPVWKDHISYFISGRRSYFLRPIQNLNNNIGDLHFGDLHFKLNYRINEKNRVYFSLYNSVDNFEVHENLASVAGINWKNQTAAIRWNHLFSDKLFSNTTLYASKYDYFLNTNLENHNYWNSHIDNFSITSDFTWYIVPENTLRFGIKLAQHFMNPGNYYVNNQLISLPYEISTKSANESSLYLSNQFVFNPNLSLRLGIRLTAWSNIGPGTEYSFTNGQLNSTQYTIGEVYHTYATVSVWFTGHT